MNKRRTYEYKNSAMYDTRNWQLGNEIMNAKEQWMETKRLEVEELEQRLVSLDMKKSKKLRHGKQSFLNKIMSNNNKSLFESYVFHY